MKKRSVLAHSSIKYLACFMLLTFTMFNAVAKTAKHHKLTFFKANNANIKYVGRGDFSKSDKPKFWTAGAYIKAKFKGSYLEIFINDEELGGNNHNYLEIAVDNKTPYRIELSGHLNKIKVDSLSNGKHTITICKDTETGIGYIEFLGLKCAQLFPVQLPKRKIEYIGDSITTGTGSDQSVIKCDKGQWFDQHNAYMSYGPASARLLNAQWHLTAVAGIGMIHSCCNMGITMPEVFEKLNLRSDSLHWDFSKYTPDVVTICLGQNDGKQDSVTYCRTYVNFLEALRSHYPNADIICLTSPMGNQKLTGMLKNYIGGIEQRFAKLGDKKIHHYFFSRSFNDGCGGHPSMAQHQLIAAELAGYIKQLENW